MFAFVSASKNIFSFGSVSKNIVTCVNRDYKYNYLLAEQSQRLYSAWENKKYFLLLGKRTKDIFLLAETMTKILFCSRKQHEK